MPEKSQHKSPAPKPAAPVPGELTPEQEKTARELLIQGATFENVVLTLAARGQQVSDLAVENFFRSNPELHSLRAKRTIQVARKIRTECEGGDPGDVELADAVIMTGLQRLRSTTAELDVNEALRRRNEREITHLRRQNVVLKGRESLAKLDLYRARKRVLNVQWETAREKLKRIKDEVENAKKGELSGPELAARIQEIYGLIEAPPVPAIGTPQSEV
jgi:hypothetical protein